MDNAELVNRHIREIFKKIDNIEDKDKREKLKDKLKIIIDEMINIHNDIIIQKKENDITINELDKILSNKNVSSYTKELEQKVLKNEKKTFELNEKIKNDISQIIDIMHKELYK